jgi:hypothetical protein
LHFRFFNFHNITFNPIILVYFTKGWPFLDSEQINAHVEWFTCRISKSTHTWSTSTHMSQYPRAHWFSQINGSQPFCKWAKVLLWKLKDQNYKFVKIRRPKIQFNQIFMHNEILEYFYTVTPRCNNWFGLSDLKWTINI